MLNYMPEDGFFMPNIAKCVFCVRGRRMHAFFENRPDSFRAFVSTGLSFPLHLHPQLEMYLIVSGETCVTIRGQERRLCAGDLAIVFPNQIHSYAAQSPDAQALLVICDLAYTGGYRDTLLTHHPAEPFLSAGKLHPNIAFAMQAMVAEQQEKSAAYAPLIQLSLARALPSLALKRNRSSDHQELTYQIAHYISEHFREPLTLQQLSAGLGMSKFYLSHLFSEKIGEPFPQYLSSIRLSHACSLLSETDMPVTDIAGESGFESQRTFFRAFQQRFGTTPLKYRRSAQQAGGKNTQNLHQQSQDNAH